MRRSSNTDRQRAASAGASRRNFPGIDEQQIEWRNLFRTINRSPIPMLITDARQPDNPIHLANAAFCTLTGYSESEIIGRNCRFLAGPDTDPAASAELSAAIQSQRPALVKILNYRRDGTPFRNGVMITPLFDNQGQLRWFLGSQVDLGEPSAHEFAHRRSEAAQRVAKLTARQREVLARKARGMPSKQIAWDLKISEKTVQMHRAHLLERLGVSTSAEAIRMAVEAGL